MSEYFSSIATPLTFRFIEEKAPPTMIYWMPSKSGRGAMHAEFPFVRQTIDECAFPEPNWDGYGALAIGRETKQNAIEAIKNVLLEAPAPEIVPNPNGTLSFEWGTPNGSAHLEVGQTRFSFYINPRAGTPILFDGPADQISSLHGGLVAGLLFPSNTGASTATQIRYSTDV